MLGIYNNTKNQWVGKEINDKVVCLSKEKRYKRENTDVRKTAHIIGYKTLFDGDVHMLNEKLISAYGNMKDVLTLTDKNTTIIFSKKDFNPFITERTKNLKDIFLISLDLKGKRILEISNEHTFLLEGFILGGELTLVASLNNFESTLDIQLFDSVQNKIVVYSFGRDIERNKLFMRCEEHENTGEGMPESSFSLRKFRPAKPTYTIITYKQDREQLEQIVDANVHNIEVITKDTMDQVIQRLKDDHYKSVTLFVNSEEFTETTGRIYGSAITNLSRNFKVYYEIMSTGKIHKMKV